jgi:REP element-mobilizing transposase RayT
MEDYQSLSHTRWQCKYHVIFIPKYRRKTLFGVVRKELGAVFRRLAEQKECRIEEGHILPDHVHMLISIPAEAVGFERRGVPEGQERDPRRPALSQTRTQLRWAEPVGEGILRR